MKADRKILKLPEGRLSFAFLATPKPRTRDDGTPAEPKYECVVLLDPSNPTHATAIAEIKAEATRIAETDEKLKGTPVKKLINAFGSGDKRALDEDGEANPTYEAYKGMFYVNCSSTIRPLIGDRRGKVIEKDNPQFPYSGCFANVKVTLYAWYHRATNRRGISVDLRSVQFVKDGPAFGRGPINADDEFEMLGDAPGEKAGAADDWD